MKAHLLLNEVAGPDRAAVSPPELAAAFAQAGIEVRIERITPRTIDSTVRDIIARGTDAIFVGGGDGTISACAGRLAGSEVPLGALPLGTYNHFAKDLGVPGSWAEAVSALAAGAVRAIDVGEVNGRVFINNCSLGAYPDAVRLREALRRQGRGRRFAMLLASLLVFRRLRRLRLTLVTPGGTQALRAPFVLVANNEYCGNILETNLRERLDAGRLWIYSTRARRRITLLRLMGQSLLGRIDAVDRLDRHDTTEAEIRSEERAVPVAMDGEMVELRPPFRFRIRPRTLRVLAPAIGHENAGPSLRSALRR